MKVLGPAVPELQCSQNPILLKRFIVKTAGIAENKIKFLTKIFWVGPFLEGRSGKGKQDIYSSQP